MGIRVHRIDFRVRRVGLHIKMKKKLAVFGAERCKNREKCKECVSFNDDILFFDTHQ
jgi:hypothetical protein